MPRVSHQLEYSLYVVDLGQAAAFYQRVLGFEEFLRDDRMIGLGVPGNSVLLLFRRGSSVEPSSMPTGTIPPHDATGQQHLAFAIPVGELQAWETHLAVEGVALESHVTWPSGGVSLYFRDADQHLVEVATPGLWPCY